jgi:hypothetical protein
MDHCFAHGFTFLGCHGSCFGFKVHISFAGAVFSDDLVEAVIG